MAFICLNWHFEFQHWRLTFMKWTTGLSRVILKIVLTIKKKFFSGMRRCLRRIQNWGRFDRCSTLEGTHGRQERRRGINKLEIFLFYKTGHANTKNQRNNIFCIIIILTFYECVPHLDHRQKPRTIWYQQLMITNCIFLTNMPPTHFVHVI